MDQGKTSASKQSLLDFKCKKIIPDADKSSVPSQSSVEKSASLEHQKSEAQIVTLTPQKINEPSHKIYKENAIKLSEKYKIIAEFFDCMICSLRLLNLGKKMPTFQNICKQVETLAKREFSYRHLAMIKYILPEAIQIDKILVHDHKTICMKQDMKVTLRLDAIDSQQERSAFVALRKLFSSRLLSFFETQPEDSDVPEAILPVPFNPVCQKDISEVLPAASTTDSQQFFVNTKPLVHSAHLCPSFSQHFSLKSNDMETEKTRLIASPVTLISTKTDVMPKENIEKQIEGDASSSLSEFTTIDFFNVQESPIEKVSHFSSCVQESPVGKSSVTTESIMIETPAQLPPKRLMPSFDNKVTDCQKQSTCHAKRSIDFSSFEEDENALDSNADDLDCKVVHKAMAQTSKARENVKQGNFCDASALVQQVSSKGLTVENHVVNRVGVLSGFVTDLVPVINHIFKSSKCSSITKEELEHKIIMNVCDIDDRREVEEQMGLLEKLAPDWIFKKLTPSGDVLYTIKSVPDLDSIRARLSIYKTD